MTARILVVDDIPANVKLLEVRLLAEYFEVLTALNGPDAIETCENGKVDVVLLDVMMPGVDGWAVLEQLKSHLDDRIKSVKVLMMTALGADDDRLRGGIEGAVRYLVKPVTPDELRDAVAGVLAGGPEREQRHWQQPAGRSNPCLRTLSRSRRHPRICHSCRDNAPNPSCRTSWALRCGPWA